MGKAALTNALTIDVEDYFQVSAFAPYIARKDWDHQPCRVERNVGRILQMLDHRRVKATFFTLGWLADRYPGMVREIVAGGHELASHGYGHERASDLDHQAFRDDVVRSKRVLEDVGGVVVKGYRAPSFSIGKSNMWALETLAHAGYVYSSSIYPIAHDHYGLPDSPRFPYQTEQGLLEVPISTVRLLSRNWPSSGGGYFRLLPYGLTRWMLQRINSVERAPAIFYFHPWEIDPGQPRVAGIDRKTRFRHYVNIDRNESKLAQLLVDFSWGRMDEIFLDQSTSTAKPALANGA